jgi:hypothetical protein
VVSSISYTMPSSLRGESRFDFAIRLDLVRHLDQLMHRCTSTDGRLGISSEWGCGRGRAFFQGKVCALEKAVKPRK